MLMQPKVLVTQSATVPVGVYDVEEIRFDMGVMCGVIIKHAGHDVGISTNSEHEHVKILFYTGYTDAMDRPIYENDMMAITTPYGTECGRVTMSKGRYVVEMMDHKIGLNVAVDNNAMIV